METDPTVIDLSTVIDHVIAPIWYQAEYGRPEIAPSIVFQCPVCKSWCRLNQEDSYIISRATGMEELPVCAGPLKMDDPQSKEDRGVSFPMICMNNNHQFILCLEMDHESGRLKLFVLLRDEVYLEKYPEAYERWG